MYRTLSIVQTTAFLSVTYNEIRFKQPLYGRQPIFSWCVKPLPKPNYVVRYAQKSCSLKEALRSWKQ